MGLLKTIRYNLANLVTFKGREARGQFWPYAAFVFVLSIAGMMAIILPEIFASIAKMQRFAAEHPELVTVKQGPGSYSISIKGNHPELMPDMARASAMMAVVFIFAVIMLAAAIVRRLHDRGKSGTWGLMPLPFIVVALVIMPTIFVQSPPEVGLILALFVNNMLYIAALVFLIVLLAGAGSRGSNRFGAEPTL